MGVAASKTEGPDRAFRRGLMLYGSTAAITAALMVADGGLSPVFAQTIGPRISPTEAAQGSFSVPGGTPTPFFESRSDTLDIVNVNRNAVLNWTPYDSANNTNFVNFLPQDAELRFVGNGQNFTVINRIITADNGAGAYRPIAIQGTVSSYLFGDGPNSVGPQGGNVWFYSPGGILATGTAAFNVGSLLLSTSDFVNSNNYANYSVASFSGVTDPMAKVSLLPGAQVNLPQPGSSLVIFSPSIDQGGTVTVNGSAAYISAVSADVFISGSGDLFTSIYEGAVAGNRITHTGTTTGPASIGTQDFSVFDPQTIEFLGSGDVGALLSGSIGYAPATNATLMPNGSIRLSIGDVESAGNLQFTSNTTIDAPGSVTFIADAGETITGGSDVNGGYGLTVNTPSASFGAGSGGTIDFAGNVEFQNNVGSVSYILFADGVNGMLPAGSISVGGDLVLDATAGRSGSGEPIGSAIGTVTDGGSIIVGGSLLLLADSFATETMVGTSARGGTASFTVTGATSSLMVGGALEISADALPFTPFCECSAPSGFGDAGDATFTVDAGMVTAGSLLVSADATAHFSPFNIDGLADFHATAGNAWVDLGNSTANFGSIDISASATGARGVDGLTGGVATGGDVRFAKGSGGSFTTGSLQFAANATGGNGGDFSGSTESSGSGGAAQGGSIMATLLQNAGGLSLFGMRANGTGGAAGDIVESSGIDGGSGGEGRGGSASLVLGGAGTVLGSISEGIISASGTGGAGGYGTESDGFGPAGSGGAGGIGRGGALAVEAGTGAEFAIQFSISATATGGVGGAGGNGAFGQPDIVPPAPGGHGGDVFGGAVSLIAADGTISGQLDLDVGGSAGAGGTNGFDAFENYTGEAPFGYATGGAIVLETSGTAGLFSLDYATLLASADAAGTVDLVNGSTGSGAGMNFGSLYIDAYSSQASAGQNVTLSSVGNTIFSSGSIDIYGDAIGLGFAGGSGLAGQSVSLGAYQGGIALTNATATGEAFVSGVGNLSLFATGDIVSGPRTRLSSIGGSFVRSNGGDIAIAKITGGSTTISARGNVELGDADIVGTLNILGGLEDFDGIQAYHPEGNVTVTGSVGTDFLAIASGGTSRFAGGSAIASNDAIEVRTGDDIIVEAGASLVSDIAPDFGSTIFLYAGDINLGGMNGDLVEPILTPIASVVVRGTLNSNGHGVFLTGDAVDATGSTILTGDLLVDVTDVPGFGPLSSDGGLLMPGCFQGSACLGNLSASSEVFIGFDSADLQTLRIGSLSFSGTTFRARAAETISLGTAGIPSSLIAPASLALTSLSGDIALTDVSISAGSINLSAENGTLLGNGNLSSVNEIVLGIGGSISAGQITTGATIVREPEGSSPFLAGGDFLVAGLETGGGSPVAIEAAGNISIGLADPNGAAITLTGQSVQLVQSSTDTASIALSGTSVQFGALNAIGAVSIDSSVGTIVGSGPGSISAGGAIALSAKTALTTGGLSAGGAVDAVAGTTASLGAISTTAGGVTISAGNGLVVGSVQTADTGALDDIRLTGETISTGALTSGDNILLSALFPMMTSASGNYSARLGISANAGGNFATLSAGTFIDITGGSISVLGADAGTSLNLVTSAGSVTALGPLSAGSTATLAAQQALTVGSLTAAGNVAATAGTNLGFALVQSSGGNVVLAGGAGIMGAGPGSVTAAGSVLINSTQALSVGPVQAGGNINVMAGTSAALGNIATTSGGVTASAGNTLAVGNVQTANTSASNDVALSAAGGVMTGTVISGDNIVLSGPVTALGDMTALLAINANGGGNFRSLDAGTLIDVSGGAISLSGANAGTSLRLATPTGDLVSTGPLVAGTTADLSSQGSIGIGALTSGGNVVAIARNDLAFSAMSSTGGSVALTSQQNGIAGSGPGSISAAGAVSLNANTALVTGAVQAGGIVTGTAGGGNSSLGAVSTTSGSVNLSTSGTLSVASVQTANTGGVDDIVLSAAVGLSTGTLNAGDDIRLTGPVNATGNYTAGLGITADRGGNFRALNAGTAIDVSGGPISLTGATAGTSLRLAAMSGGLLATGPLSAGTTATLSASNGIAIEALTAGGNATLNAGGTLAGTDWTSGGLLSLTGSALTVGKAAGALGMSATIGGAATFASLGSSGGAVSLSAAGNVAGGNIAAAGTVSLSGAAVTVGDLTAGTGLSVDADSFDGDDLVAGADLALTADAGVTIDTLTAGGGIELAAGRLVAVATSSGLATEIFTSGDAEIASANSADEISVSGASVSLGSATFGGGLALTARTGDVTGTGLYEGTGSVILQAAQDIAIGSVDTLGAVTLDAARDVRFAELRSTDGNVFARAAGVISGSTVSATGGNGAGEDTVSLIAGGDLTLTGTVTALNPSSFAQDDFLAESGGTLSIASVEAQRDILLKAGAGTLTAVNISSGRDLALTAPTIRIDDASVAGNLTVSATDGDITGAGTTTAAGEVALTASGGIAVGNIAANGGGIAADAGGTIEFGNLTASGLVMLGAASGISGTGSIASGGGVVLATETGATALFDIVAAGPTSLSGGGSLTVNDVTLSTGSLTVSYDGEIVLRNGRSGANIAIDGGAGVAFASLDAANGVDLEVLGAIAGGTISAGQAARVQAGGAIGLTGLAATNASMVSAGGRVSASGVAVSGLLDVEGTAVTLAAPGALEVQARATAGTLAVTTAGDLRIDGQATGDIALASTGGSVIIGTVGQQNFTGNGNATGTQALGGGAAIAISAANGISVADSLTSAGALGLTAGGLVALDGATTGQTIGLQSGDLAIGMTGSLGQASTQRISLSSTNAVNLGSGATGGFAIDAGEFSRIASGGDLLVTALAGAGTGAGSITVGALSVNAGSGGQIGTSGAFSLTAAGLLDVNNTLSIGQGGSGNTLMLTGDAVDLDYANAALSVLDAASASTGRIIVNGRLITSLSASATADIVGKTPAEITIRLGQADVTRTTGLFRAGNLTLEGRDAILIQNSGGNAVDERRGLTVGSLTVTGAPDGRTLVVINGVIGTATGNNAAQIVTVTTPIAAGSSFNGCVLATAADCLAVAPPPAPGPIFAPGSIVNETSDLIKKEEEEEDDEVKDGVADGKNDAPPIDTRFIDDPAGRPMLDDPVTGAGNEDLWQPPEG